MRLSRQVFARLKTDGELLDTDDLQFVVGSGGEVSLLPIENKELNDGTFQQGTAGRQGSPRWQGAAGGEAPAAPGPPPRFWGGSLREHYLDSLAELLAYFDAQVIQQQHGLWVVARVFPLGVDGPQFWLAIAVPFHQDSKPQGWAFLMKGNYVEPIGPRHTNFPDHSICADGEDEKGWYPIDGLRALVSLYSTWLFRQLYFQQFGLWPCRQWGATALYRRLEFHPDEWCGCGKNRRYRNCHMEADALLSEQEAVDEHIAKFGSPYRKRTVPSAVMSFARSNWNKVPLISPPTGSIKY